MYASHLVPYLFFAIPLIVLAGFVVSLVLYLTAKRASKRDPNSYTDKQLKTRLICTIVLGTISACMAAVVLGLMLLLLLAVAFM